MTGNRTAAMGRSQRKWGIRRHGGGEKMLHLMAIAMLLVSTEISSMQVDTGAGGALRRDRKGAQAFWGPRLRGGSDSGWESAKRESGGARGVGEENVAEYQDKGGKGILKALSGLKGLVFGKKDSEEDRIQASPSLQDEENSMFEALRTQGDRECSATIASLLAAGCSPRAVEVSRCNYGLVHLAADRGLLDTIGVLYEHGADMNMRGKHGQTPLHVAASKGQESAVKALLGLKAKIDDKDQMGWTALHQASYFGHAPVVELLLQHGAHKNATTVQGWNAADVCCKGVVEAQADCEEVQRRILALLPAPTNRTINMQEQFRVRGASARNESTKNSLEKFAEGRSRDVSFKDRFSLLLNEMHEDAVMRSQVTVNLTQNLDQIFARHRENLEQMKNQNVQEPEHGVDGDGNDPAPMNERGLSQSASEIFQKMMEHNEMLKQGEDTDARSVAEKSEDRPIAVYHCTRDGRMLRPSCQDEKRNENCGVGLSVRAGDRGEYIISALLANGPAERSQVIKVGDVLEEVDGKKANSISPDDLVRMILGPVGSTVRISVRDPWDVRGNNTKSVELERRNVDDKYQYGRLRLHAKDTQEAEKEFGEI